LLAPPSHQHRDEPSVLTAYTSSIVSYNEVYKIMNIAPELELVKELSRQVINIIYIVHKYKIYYVFIEMYLVYKKIIITF